MSRKNDHFVDGCLAQTWPLLIILAPILYAISFIVENIGIILIIVIRKQM
jgi:hypothetical protein